MEAPAIYENFEWLSGEMERGGKSVIYDEARLTAGLDGDVNSTRESLRIEQSLRTVILASPEVMLAAPPAPATPVEA
jgi:hypothetical protein